MAPRALLLALTLALCCLVSPAAAAPRWSDGNLAQDLYNVNCPSVALGSPYYEYEVGLFMGQYVDDGSPVVGEVFDVHLVVHTLGNECAGTRPKLEIALPPGVVPAVGGGHTIRCYLKTGSGTAPGPVSAAEGCPTALTPGTTNHPAISQWWSLNPPAGTAAAPAWPLPQGVTLEIQVPVVASRTMNGIGDTTGCVCAVASVQTINGLSAPDNGFSWASSAPLSGAYIPLFVFPAPPGSTPGGTTAPGGGSTPGGSTPGGSTPGGSTPGGTGGPGGTVPGAPGATNTSAGPALQPAPSTWRRSQLRTRKAQVQVGGLQAGDKLSLEVLRGRTKLATARVTAKGASAKLRPRPSRSKAAARELRKQGTVKVLVKITRNGERLATLRASVRLR